MRPVMKPSLDVTGPPSISGEVLHSRIAKPIVSSYFLNSHTRVAMEEGELGAGIEQGQRPVRKLPSGRPELTCTVSTELFISYALTSVKCLACQDDGKF